MEKALILDREAVARVGAPAGGRGSGARRVEGLWWGGCVGCEAVYVASEFPPSTAGAVPLPPRGTAFLGLLLRSRLQTSIACDIR